MSLRSALVAASLISILPSTASAHVNGAMECNPDHGEWPRVVYDHIWVPNRMTNADRADTVVTMGGGDLVESLLASINQLFTHALFVSGTSAGNTWFTHETAVMPSAQNTSDVDIDLFRAEPVLLNGDNIARMIPGNVEADPADRVLYGNDADCLEDHSVADCLARDARPKTLDRTNTLLLKPANRNISVNALDAAEARAEHSMPYSVSSYSDWAAAWNGTGVESANGIGAACSGFVAGHLQAAGENLVIRTYTAGERLTAALALQNTLFPVLEDRIHNAGWFSALIPNAWESAIAQDMTDQVTNCFAFGGDCLDGGATWMTPGTGTSYAPDDLIPASVTNPTTGYQPANWATAHTAGFAGGYSYQEYSHLECCWYDNIDGGIKCRRPGWPGPSLELVVGPGGDNGGPPDHVGAPIGAGPGEEIGPIQEEGPILQPEQPVEIDYIDHPKRGQQGFDAIFADRQQWATPYGQVLGTEDEILAIDGVYIEYEDSYCFSNDRGEICVSLDPAMSDEARAEVGIEIPGADETNPTDDVAAL